MASGRGNGDRLAPTVPAEGVRISRPERQVRSRAFEPIIITLLTYLRRSVEHTPRYREITLSYWIVMPGYGNVTIPTGSSRRAPE